MWSIAVVIQGNIKYLRLLNMPIKPQDTQMAESLTSEASVSNVAILIQAKAVSYFAIKLHINLMLWV